MGPTYYTTRPLQHPNDGTLTLTEFDPIEDLSEETAAELLAEGVIAKGRPPERSENWGRRAARHGRTLAAADLAMANGDAPLPQADERTDADAGKPPAPEADAKAKPAPANKVMPAPSNKAG